MPPRNDEPPRRGQQPRRGASRDVPAGDEEGRRGFGGIGEARAYTPRGRTVAERDQRTRSPRAGRNTDPFRPALQLLEGGKPRERRAAPPQETRDETPAKAAPRKRATAGAGRTRTEATGRAARERKVAVPPAPRRTAGGRPAKAAPPPPPRRPANRRPLPVVPAEPPRLANSTRRLRLGTVLALALFATIGVRLVVLQSVESPESLEQLNKQRRDRLTEVLLPAARGSILDRNGEVLAHSVEARYVYADPELVKDPVTVAARLSPLLGVAPSKLTKLMAKKRPGGGAVRFVYLARGVDVGVADQIRAMNLAGIGEDRDERRDLPGADLAANLIGFTGEDHTGLEGLEARYDQLLRGVDGKKVYEAGRGDLDKEIPGGYHKVTRASPGTSLQLTIDRDLQFEVQRILAAKMRDVNAKIAGAVVIDAHTGEVMAQASYPAYNAAKPFDAKATDREDVVSSVIADPGSTHKALVFGAALQEGLITPDSVQVIGPSLTIGGKPFADTHPQPKGTKMTMSGLLAYSSNVGTILVARKLGPQKLYEYQQRFGLGKATGEGMPGEAEGRLLAPDEWSGSAAGSIPVGHSVDATVLQMAAAYVAIANNGTYIQPHLIKATIPFEGPAVSAPAAATRQVLRPEVAQQLRVLLESPVYAKGGTGSLARVDGWLVAGKTGTGKRLIDGQYTKYNAGSFIGMAPVDNPRFVIAVFADVPTGAGGGVAGPAFSEMMKATLLHYRVPFSATKPPNVKLYP
ncbi:penicillin-binding transpeptidase domain-containing protein [Actinoplanes sp. NPDC049265]|uniref:penicillin-binding transpeptidase domain-containing protein n=1 Tax=Actinoplanes sp. NPDC049265 TaxID=3363902 RepID=UPI003712D2C6